MRSGPRKTIVVALALTASVPLGTRLSALGRVQQPPARAFAARLTAGERAAIAKLPKGAGREIFLGGCLTCHSASIVVMQHKDSTGWHRTVTTMIASGATVPEARKGELVAYLTRHFPARGEGPTPPVKP